MKKYEVSIMKTGFIIERNFVMAENEDEAQQRYEDDEYLNDEWEVMKDDMSTDDVDIKEVK
tara:strand:- start:1183 stop:1365 length:183 start_codon:yes stop_codon:yes gene_type:complete